MEEVTLGGPCDQSLEVGDILTHIGDVCVTGKKIEDVVQYANDEEGSAVELTFRRGKNK